MPPLRVTAGASCAGRVVFHGKRDRTALHRREFHGKLSDLCMDATVFHGKRRRRGARFSRRAWVAVASRQSIVWGEWAHHCSRAPHRAGAHCADQRARRPAPRCGPSVGPPHAFHVKLRHPQSSPAVLACACTNDFEPPLRGESYDMANSSEKGGIASSAPAVAVQHSVPFHGKLTHRTLPSAAGPTLRCVRRERFAGEGGWGRMEQECVPSSFGPHADGASRSCFTGNMPVTCKNVGPTTGAGRNGVLSGHRSLSWGGFHVCPKDVPTPAATPRRHGPT